jgi:beta-phosphoglucomutase-like phosphatase (HAD superfamily)
LQAANRFGDAPGWIVVFEDALHAAHTAKQAGFLAMGVLDRHEKQQAAPKALWIGIFWI